MEQITPDQEIKVGSTAVQFIGKQDGVRWTSKFQKRVYTNPHVPAGYIQWFPLWLGTMRVHNIALVGFRITALKNK